MRFAAALVTGLVVCVPPARGDDVDPIPLPCGDGAGCEVAGLDFWWEESAFDDIMWDTGWVPTDSDVQVRFALTVLGRTQVGMSGTAETSWPEPLTVGIPGQPATGWLSVGYGAQLTAKLRFHVTILGSDYDWEGDLPFISDYPTDLLLLAETVFDPFVLAGAPVNPVTAYDITDRFTVFTYDILGAVGIPGVEGSVSLQMEAALEARYHTARIDVGTAPVIFAEGGTTRLDPPGPEGYGAAADFSVLPWGIVDYAGGFNLYPHVTVEIIGFTVIDEDLAAIPIVLDLTSVPTAFEPAAVHVPLPDVGLTPGELAVTETAPGLLTFENAGEAPLLVHAESWPASLVGLPPSFVVAPGATQDVEVTPVAGAESGVVLVAFSTNDPDTAELVVPVTVTAIPAPPEPDAGPGGPGDGDAGGGPGGELGSPDGGCGCRAGGGGTGTPGGLLLSALGLALVSLSRTSPRRRSRRARA